MKVRIYSMNVISRAVYTPKIIRLHLIKIYKVSFDRLRCLVGFHLMLHTLTDVCQHFSVTNKRLQSCQN